MADILVFQPHAADAPPRWSWTCGAHDGSLAHIWDPVAKDGDPCRCGAHRLPARRLVVVGKDMTIWRAGMPSEGESLIAASGY